MKENSKYYFFKVCYLLIVFVLFSVKGIGQTLDECQSMAEQNYPLIRRCALLEYTTRLTLEEISKGWLPTITATVQGNYQSSVSTLPDALASMMRAQGTEYDGLGRFQYRAGVDIVQPIYDGGHINGQRKVAKAEGEVQKAQNETNLYQLRQRVNDLYFGLLLVEDRLQMNADLQELYRTNEAKLQAMYNHGTASLADLNIVKAERISVNQQRTELDIEGIVINHNILAKVLDENRLPSFSGKHAFLRMQPNKEELRFIGSILDQMTILVRQTNFYQTTLYHLMTALLSYSDQLFLSKLETQEQHTTHNQKIFGQFLDLVNRFATQEHTIDFYANRLCISPRYLGTIIKKVTGITAKAWIDRSIITAIKIELRHSEKGIKQLTDEMAFPNESFFCKYFKRLTGLTPMEYREKLERLE